VSGRAILVVNAGSTSLKLRLVDDTEKSQPLVQIDAEPPDWGSAVADHLRAASGRIEAVAHRVVHGGPSFREPVLIDEAVYRQLANLVELAPLHNPPALAGIADATRALPDVPQVAVFDTSFHNTIPPAAATYAVPSIWREQWNIRRYGFHGLSVGWCAERVPELMGRSVEGLRLVVCHLGGGSSVSAVADGRSRDTTMGFSPIEGVPMWTRSGSVDPGALLYLIREHGLSDEHLEQTLNFGSGLKALSGGLTDMVELERAAATGSPDAQLAIEVFCHRLAGAVAAMAASAGGIDALAFTAGVGEGSALVRAEVGERLAFLGVAIDPQLNLAAHGDREVSGPAARVRVFVIHAQEEIPAARAARAVVAGSRRT
jgi:acetate kinase